MENLCSCDEIRGFQVARERNRPCVGGFHVRPRRKPPKHKREKPGGFHVRPQRNPPKSATMGNPWFPCPAATETAQNRKRGKPTTANGNRPKSHVWETSGFHVRPRREPPKLSARNLGLPCPSAIGTVQVWEIRGFQPRTRENRCERGKFDFPVFCRDRKPRKCGKIKGSHVGRERIIVHVQENLRFPSRSRNQPCKSGKSRASMSSRERNRESDGKIEVFESVKKETVQVRESRGFHVRSRRKPCKCGEIRGFRALSRRKRCKCGEISGLCVRPLWKPCKCGEIHGFRVRSRRKPCKCEESGVSMSRRDGNRPSAGYSGFPCPTAPETVQVRGNSGCPCPAAMETVQVRGNSGCSCPTARWKPRKCGKPLAVHPCLASAAGA